MLNDRGQIILILLLVMVVALGVGLSVVQRSLVDISTSSQVEQSSRAFSAAEAGIERAASLNTSITSPIDLGNNSNINKVDVFDRMPAPFQIFELPALSKEGTIQIWLADPDTLSSYYTAPTLDIYWGNVGVTGADRPAIEVYIIYKSTGGLYKSVAYSYDQDALVRNNGLSVPAAPSGQCPSTAVTTSLTSVAKQFYCKMTIDVSRTKITDLNTLMMLKARILYSGTNQAFAVGPASGESLPPQAKLYISTGKSGETQRTVQLFEQDKVVPHYFDYAIFSIGEIAK